MGCLTFIQNNLLKCACLVAESLSADKDKWEILTSFWVEHQAQVASLCLGSNHAQHLRKGGEFLTDMVRLLIEHLNLFERFRMPLTQPEWNLNLEPLLQEES